MIKKIIVFSLLLMIFSTVEVSANASIEDDKQVSYQSDGDVSFYGVYEYPKNDQNHKESEKTSVLLPETAQENNFLLPKIVGIILLSLVIYFKNKCYIHD